MQIKAFIIRNNYIYDLDECISAYKNTFAGAPWFENWSDSDAKKIILQATKKEGFKSSLINLDNKILGFAFGYNIPKKDTRTVKFSQINNLLKNINYNNAFYLAECGIVQDFQNKGLGTLLIKELKNQNVDTIVLRTINNNMLKIVERVYGNITNLFNDPQYKERVWFGSKNGNR